MNGPLIVQADYSAIRRWVCTLSAAVVALGLLVFAAKHLLGHGNLLGLGPLFSLRDEHNLPTYFSSLLLLVAACATGLTAKATKVAAPRDGRLWCVLAIGFLFLSIDESVGLHEALGNSAVVSSSIDGLFIDGRPGYLYFGWLALALPLLLLLALVFLPFLLRQERALRWRLLGCGTLYVGAAVGLQLVEGWLRTLGTSAQAIGLAYDAATVIEETLEISAIAAYTLTLLGRLIGPGRQMRLVIG